MPGGVLLDPSDRFDLERAKAEALAVLGAHGYRPSQLYGDEGACFALERVRHDGHGDDSPSGLAAQALQHCRELELWLRLYPSAPLHDAMGRVADHAYRIGRCLAFAKAYRIESVTQSERRKGKPGTADGAKRDDDRNARIRAKYLKAEGARGIVKALAIDEGLSAKTIGRIIKDLRT